MAKKKKDKGGTVSKMRLECYLEGLKTLDREELELLAAFQNFMLVGASEMLGGLVGVRCEADSHYAHVVEKGSDTSLKLLSKCDELYQAKLRNN